MRFLFHVAKYCRWDTISVIQRCVIVSGHKYYTTDPRGNKITSVDYQHGIMYLKSDYHFCGQARTCIEHYTYEGRSESKFRHLFSHKLYCEKKKKN